MLNPLPDPLHNSNLVPPDKQALLARILEQAEALEMPTYLVGGFVRDALLGLPANDFDIVVEGDAIFLGESLVKKFGGRLVPHHKFHTAVWRHPSSLCDHELTLDLITARSEKYAYPGALPTVVPADIHADLRRRDFTINAMALCLRADSAVDLLDPFDGRADLQQGLLRVLHPASFSEDPTRILRAIRYAHRYSLKIEPSTAALINPDSLSVLNNLSARRLHHEFDLIFNEDDPALMITSAAQLGVLDAIHAGLPALDPSRGVHLKPGLKFHLPLPRITLGYVLWLLDLPENLLDSIAERLNFSSGLRQAVNSASALLRALPALAGAKPSAWVLALDGLPLVSVYAVHLVTGESALLYYLTTWRHIKPNATGSDLKVRGLPPGAQYGKILNQLRAGWLDGQIKSREEEDRLLERLLSSFYAP